MTGREKILAAFAPGGTPQVGAVASYDGLFLRDHWQEITDVPWWYAFSGAAEKEVAWAGDYYRKTGLEWIRVRPCPSRRQRQRRHYEKREGGVWFVDDETGEEIRLAEPTRAGTNSACARSRHTDVEMLPASREEVDALVPAAEAFDQEAFLTAGRQDAAAAIGEALDEPLLYGHVSSPVWSLYGLFGYEGMMLFVAQTPGLASYAGRRILQGVSRRIRMLAALGAEAVWIEECLTDQVSPRLFRAVNVPLVRLTVEEIRASGMKSIYYYCGDPRDRLEAILDAGADAVHFEESKKDFTIDIARIIQSVDGRCVVFGNLDAIGVLQNASEHRLRSEISRQLAAGRANGNRFVMSTGSPITPGTPVKRVRLYTDLVRELSG